MPVLVSSLSATASNSSSSTLYFVILLFIIVLIRMRRIINGSKVSVARTIGFSAYYVVFAALVLSGSLFLPIPFEYFLAYPVLFVVTMVLAFGVARHRLIFWKAADGSIYSKGGVPIYAIYIIGLIARIAIGYIYIGPNFLSFGPTQLTVSGTTISATILTDLILVAGAGLLFGRNMRILKKYLTIKKGKETLETLSGEGESTPSMPT
ncbi:MAG: hypothetical protein JRN20_08825 [Nitrososphaerota archaeon]|nr:hypothetical protein [Nitrososphaerota archaeon]MDG6923407.1 hypothetical protein [Nitrososphaerota archaeon]